MTGFVKVGFVVLLLLMLCQFILLNRYKIFNKNKLAKVPESREYFNLQDNMNQIQQRRKHMRAHCSRHTRSYPNKARHQEKVYKRLLVNEQYKFLLCPVAKIGSTFLKAVFKTLNTTERNPIRTLENSPIIRKERFPILTDFNKTEQDRILRTYTKVIFVRNPFRRLFSGYQNKFVTINYPFWSRGMRAGIIKTFRPNPSNKSLTCGHDTKFEEFLSYVIALSEKGGVENMDIHWQPIDIECDPCMIDYNIIGKMETFHSDMQYFLSTIGAEDRIELPRPGSSSLEHLRSRLKGEIKWAFNQLSKLKDCISENEYSMRIVQNFVSHGYIEPLDATDLDDLSKIRYGPNTAEKLTKWIFNYVDKSNKTYLLNLPEETQKAAYARLPRDLLLRAKMAYLNDLALFSYDSP
ncbi:unnamed protein product [Owenia fusiformis]|uniref:Carbohydrate sulfotransferase n=1 Tax=Owenia fusiformis TaxID=6347 RepID=A0A8J1XWC3_OWEFU|nr:unnamed protein product [Owenia fusiformis]